MTTLMRSIKAERIKMATTRAPYWCLGTGIALSLVIYLFAALLLEDVGDGGVLEEDARFIGFLTTFSWPPIVLVMAALAICNEHRFATIRYAYLAIPRRIAVHLGKAVVYGGVAAVLSLACVLLGMMIFAVFGSVDISWGGDGANVYWAMPWFVIMCTLLAIGVGEIVRQAAGALALLLTWNYVLEQVPLFFSFSDFGAKLYGWMPFVNGLRVVRGAEQADFPAGMWFSVVYFSVVCLVVFGLGLFSASNRDA